MKTIATIAAAAALTLSPLAAHAGGWGKGGSLINLSPSVGVGKVGVLNGSPILSGNAILSGNVTGILNGSLNGTLNNIGVGILGIGNSSKKGGRRRH